MLFPWRALALQLRHTSASVMLVAADGRVRSANRSARILFQAKRLRGHVFADLFADPVAAAVLLASVSAKEPGERSAWNTLHRRRDGRMAELYVEAARLPKIHGDDCLVTIYTPPTDIYQMDPLTGCRNRRGFDAAIESAQGQGCLAILDLNGLKQINDRFGHLLGDQVLVAVAARLLRLLSASGTVFRLGGDEFAVLFTSSELKRVEAALLLALNEVSRPVEVEAGVMVQVSAAAGVTTLDERPADDIVTEAHAAQRYAKQQKMPYAVAERDLPSWARSHTTVLATAQDLQRERERLARLARTDPLTQLPNRLALEEDAARFASFASRTNMPFSALFLDLDHFGSYNKYYGDTEGDRALVHLAEVMQAACRSEDRVYRKGGEEFVVLLPNTYMNQAVAIAERLRSAIQAAAIPHARREDGVSVLTAVLGVAQWSSGDDSPEATWTRASKPIMDLKQDKDAARNRVLISE